MSQRVATLPPPIRLVIIESPYAGKTAEDVEQNVAYARLALLDSLRRGEAPIASHLLYTQVLDDREPDERHVGIQAGQAWGRAADMFAVYTDRGISPGMEYGIAMAEARGVPVVRRSLFGDKK